MLRATDRSAIWSNGRVRRTFNATIPVELELPAEMVEPLRQLFAGEYESRYVGRGLTILDIGANVGAFTLWADLRWPGSTIHAYEPHPGTFSILERNVRELPNVTCRAAAVYPSDKVSEPLHAGFAGDGQAGLVEAMRTTWQSMADERIVEVAVAHPRDLPRADIVKVDAEGSEGAIVEGLDLSETSLLLVEYQNGEVLGRIRRAVEERFDVVEHVSHPWSEVLFVPEYRRELEGDRYGTLILVNRRHNRLRRVDEPVPAPGA